jgi:hypothetical protein
MVSCVGNGALLCLPSVAHHHTGWLSSTSRHVEPRTYVTTTEPVGPLYKPSFPVPEQYRHHFEPTMVTDSEGRLHEALADDLGAAGRPQVPPTHRLPIRR